MNIHFTDKELFEKLKQATLAKVRVGSHLYGTNNENSDEDFLYIYATSEAELQSFVWTNHQLQYKEAGIDHNFVSAHTFIRNILNGDSTINFEVVQSDELKDTWLSFLHGLKDAFNTYTMIRSYNGFAKRDCKHFNKATNDYERRKRLGHIIRGYVYADMLMNKTFDFKKANDRFVILLDEVEHNMESVNGYAMNLEVQRKELNTRFENKTLGLAKNLSVDHGTSIQYAFHLVQNNCAEWMIKQNFLKDFDMQIFINAFENWVSYE